MGVQFHETELGRRFFGKQLPELIKALTRIADALDEVNRPEIKIETREEE